MMIETKQKNSKRKTPTTCNNNNNNNKISSFSSTATVKVKSSKIKAGLRATMFSSLLFTVCLMPFAVLSDELHNNQHQTTTPAATTATTATTASTASTSSITNSTTSFTATKLNEMITATPDLTLRSFFSSTRTSSTSTPIPIFTTTNNFEEETSFLDLVFKKNHRQKKVPLFPASSSPSNLVGVANNNNNNNHLGSLDHIFNILIDMFANQTYHDTKTNPLQTRNGNVKELTPSSNPTQSLFANKAQFEWPAQFVKVTLPPSITSKYPDKSKLGLAPSYPLCSQQLLDTCCKSETIGVTLNICHQCNEDKDKGNITTSTSKKEEKHQKSSCPCDCDEKTATDSENNNNNKKIDEDGSKKRDPKPNNKDHRKNHHTNPGHRYNFAVNSYTFALSVGLPCISIVVIICTLISVTYCCRSTTHHHHHSDSDGCSSSSSSSSHGHGNRRGQSVCPLNSRDLGIVYIDVDGNGPTSGVDGKSDLSNLPPKYSEIFKQTSNNSKNSKNSKSTTSNLIDISNSNSNPNNSRRNGGNGNGNNVADRLPTYNSFRDKKINNISNSMK